MRRFGIGDDVSTRYDSVFYTLGQQEPLRREQVRRPQHEEAQPRHSYESRPASALRGVAVGRSTGVPGLPASDDWTAWDAAEMRAAVDYLEQMRIR